MLSRPRVEVDLYVSTDLRTMTAIWMGLTTLEQERAKVTLSGTREAVRKMRAWLGFNRTGVEARRTFRLP